MKTMKDHINMPIGSEEMKELLKETKETLASGAVKSNAPGSTFTQIDLWRLQKKHKTLGSSTRW
jgi:hypothetical protein